MNKAGLRYRWLCLACAAFCGGFFCSCVTTGTKVEPWMKDNQKIGTIETSPNPGGSESRFKDLRGRLLRTERHYPDGRLAGGFCATAFSYGPDGALAEEQCLNASGQLTRNDEGYALRRWLYSVSSEGDPLAEELFLEENARPVITKGGYAVLRLTKDSEMRVKKIEFLDGGRRAAPSTWLGVAGVAEVQYMYLQGVTPVTCAAFFDKSGKVIERKQLNGLTAGHWEMYY